MTRKVKQVLMLLICFLPFAKNSNAQIHGPELSIKSSISAKERLTKRTLNKSNDLTIKTEDKHHDPTLGIVDMKDVKENRSGGCDYYLCVVGPCRPSAFVARYNDCGGYSGGCMEEDLI